MVKVVVNRCYGGFGLSDEAKERINVVYDFDVRRDDPKLVAIVEELGQASWGALAQLEVVEIPDGVEWEIDEYDGIETIHEKHRSW